MDKARKGELAIALLKMLKEDGRVNFNHLNCREPEISHELKCSPEELEEFLQTTGLVFRGIQRDPTYG